MGSTEPPPIHARTDVQTGHDLELKVCAQCGLPYDDGPHGSGTAGCMGCDPTIRLRALRAARRGGGMGTLRGLPQVA